MADEPGPAGVFYDVARWRLQEQFEQIRALNTQLTGVFAAATALLVFFVAFQGFDTGGQRTTVLALIGAGVFVYALLVAVALVGYAHRRWSLRPDLNRLDLVSEGHTVAEVQRWAAIETMQSVDANEPRIQQKARVTSWAMILWAVDVLLFGAAALVAAIS